MVYDCGLVEDLCNVSSGNIVEASVTHSNLTEVLGEYIQAVSKTKPGEMEGGWMF